MQVLWSPLQLAILSLAADDACKQTLALLHTQGSV